MSWVQISRPRIPHDNRQKIFCISKPAKSSSRHPHYSLERCIGLHCLVRHYIYIARLGMIGEEWPPTSLAPGPLPPQPHLQNLSTLYPAAFTIGSRSIPSLAKRDDSWCSNLQMARISSPVLLGQGSLYFDFFLPTLGAADFSKSSNCDTCIARTKLWGPYLQCLISF
jgi:hypothetical protein